MKKILSIVASFLLLVFLIGCSSPDYQGQRDRADQANKELSGSTGQ
jgi:hypothetical protein